ncbi:MAG: DUF1799 domain-containing protein [Parvibaculum sp.]|uniref:DUF1799 domain-containing protein n=1 Tax=Parvibaculum sp. TaxID=2024848 RepID=UPI002720FC98|nr:DUF1799 domain-containing protein [Parvibaculum sp.]MDO8838025.1 DUF1799 domain-containing protein [Parvibaculum sp.]
MLDRENEPAVTLFLGTGTQWRSVALSTMERAAIVRTGIDYAGAEAAARGLGIAWNVELVAGLRVMEDETIRIESAARAREWAKGSARRR